MASRGSPVAGIHLGRWAGRLIVWGGLLVAVSYILPWVGFGMGPMGEIWLPPGFRLGPDLSDRVVQLPLAFALAVCGELLSRGIGSRRVISAAALGASLGVFLVFAVGWMSEGMFEVLGREEAPAFATALGPGIVALLAGAGLAAGGSLLALRATGDLQRPTRVEGAVGVGVFAVVLLVQLAQSNPNAQLTAMSGAALVGVLFRLLPDAADAACAALAAADYAAGRATPRRGVDGELWLPGAGARR